MAKPNRAGARPRRARRPLQVLRTSRLARRWAGARRQCSTLLPLVSKKDIEIIYINTIQISIIDAILYYSSVVRRSGRRVGGGAR